MTHSEAGYIGAMKSNVLRTKRKLEQYYAAPNHCLQCEHIIIIGSKTRDARRKKFCNNSCAALYNNIRRSKTSICKLCGIKCERSSYQFCSGTCHQKFIHNNYIEKWKSGRLSGSISGGKISKHIRDYLFDKYESKCYHCGWSRINPKTGKIPLVANHINGDSSNCREDNLELICPSCDSLTPTYMALNRGQGRFSRRQRYAAGKSA